MDRAIALVPGLDPQLLGRVVERLFELEPSMIAVLVSGSYAKGIADADSDLDVQVVTASEPESPYRMWFEQRTDSKPLHVSPSVKSLANWLAKREEAQPWALGFPAEHTVRYIWATEDARAALGDPPSNLHPPAEPGLEDFVEFMAKLRRAAKRGEARSIRAFAYQAALLAPGLLRTVNAEVLVHDRLEALDAALSLDVAPTHYRDDLSVCLGLVQADEGDVLEAGLRLGRELLAFLRRRNPNADPQPDIAQYLADGTLERHVGFLD